MAHRSRGHAADKVRRAYPPARTTEDAGRKKIRVAVLIGFINGVVHACSLFFIPYFEPYQRALQTMLMMGIASTSIVTTVGFLPLSLCYNLPTMVPLFSLWALSPRFSTQTGQVQWLQLHSEYGLIDIAIAVVGLSYNLILIRVSAQSFEKFADIFRIRRKLADLNNELEIARDQAEIASAAKTRFLAAASHDLRQPIHTLSLFCAALNLQPLDDRSRNIAGHMGVALESLASQLDALLDISKLDAGVMKVSKKHFDLSALISRLHGEFSVVASHKGVVLHVQCPTDIWTNTDASLLEIVLRNLVSNAIKYTEQGSVSILASVQDRHCDVRIIDTGCGIAETEHERIFEEFYQVDNPGRDRSMGLGLGLAIVRRIVMLLGIGIKVSSTPKVGSVFSLTLDRMAELDTSPHKLHARNTNHVELSLEGMTVLVVDDEAQIREGMNVLLQMLGCKVLLAACSDEAAAIVRDTTPDLILADFRLGSGEDGISTIKRIRQLKGALPALLISGDTAPERLRDASNAGIPLLTKPVSVTALETAIKNIRITDLEHRSGG